jgi:AAA family ATPase
MSTFIVRPAGTEKDPIRVRMTAVAMLGLRLKPGETCEIKAGESSNGSGKRKLAVVWEGSSNGMKDTVIQTSRALQDLYGFSLGDKITVSRSAQPIEESSRVTLRSTRGPPKDHDARYYTKVIADAISSAGEYWVIGQKIEYSDAVGFEVTDVGIHDAMVARVTSGTVMRTLENGKAGDDGHDFKPEDLKFDGLGGLDEQMTRIYKMIRDICRPIARDLHADGEPAHGALLYGAKGTGKTALIKALAHSGFPTVTYWKPGTRVRVTTELHLIIVESQYLSRGSGSAAKSYVPELLELFGRTPGSRAVVIGEAPHPNDIDLALRNEDTFEVEIELPIPSAEQRLQILYARRGNGIVPSNEMLELMAEKTHGYVGRDLVRLTREIFRLACDGLASSQINTLAQPADNVDLNEKAGYHEKAKLDENAPPTQNVIILESDLDRAMSTVRPSALQEIFLERPKTRWTDIGGLHEIKRQLRNAIERPLKFADRMAALRMEPKKGVLLYGPPGCSKTLLVRALANEAGLNFLAVKGAELVSMYVGESERATREVFRKARAAAPCIIFFDEIDAIASHRKSTSSDLNVLTTLLNEMDGFEELRNVFVVGATNKPMDIDAALMRPGRFDSVVYIGPPDDEARREILLTRLDGIYDGDLVADVDGRGGVGKVNGYHNATLDAFAEVATDGFVHITEGLSGAEVVAVCQHAAEFAFDANRGVIVREDVIAAAKMTPRSITKEILQEYRVWNDARKARG